MLYVKSGDILSAPENIICQAVDCCGAMNSELGRKICEKYPDVYKEYRNMYISAPEDAYRNSPKYSLFGQVLYVKIGTGKYIANLVTQEIYWERKGAVFVDYKAIRTCMENLSKLPLRLSIAIPYGLCCDPDTGNWEQTIRAMYESLLSQGRVVSVYKNP